MRKKSKKKFVDRIHFNKNNVHFKENAIIFVQIERMLEMHSKYNGKIKYLLGSIGLIIITQLILK